MLKKTKQNKQKQKAQTNKQSEDLQSPQGSFAYTFHQLTKAE